MEGVLPKPEWLRVRASVRPEFETVRRTLKAHGLRTVCDSSHCPNIGDCWSKRSATFLILGSICTRACRFCAVTHGRPVEQWSSGEAVRLAQGILELGLEHVVITSVTRDDLPDGGAHAYVDVLEQLGQIAPDCSTEVLIPDLGGDEKSLARIVNARPSVLGHNVEVIPRLQGVARDARASFDTSIGVLRAVKRSDPSMVTKTSLMLGLGEEGSEVHETLSVLNEAQVDILTIGQYLRPGPGQLPVRRYVPPEEFARWREEALRMGFGQVLAGPFVRSSYQAKEAFDSLRGGA